MAKSTKKTMTQIEKDLTKMFSPENIESGIKWLKTGFNNLDSRFGEWAPGLYTIGAPSNVGKTTFCLQLAAQMSEVNDVPALYFTCEQTKEELYGKLVARIQKELGMADRSLKDTEMKNWSTDKEIINFKKWGDYPPKKVNNIMKAMGVCVEKYPKLYLFERELVDVMVLEQPKWDPVQKKLVEQKPVTKKQWRSVDLGYIHSTIEKFIDKKEGGVVVVDYLQWLPLPEAIRDTQRAMRATLEKFSCWAREFNISIILISSLSNEMIKSAAQESSNNNQIIGCFKGSGDIQYASDHTFMLVPRDGDYDHWAESKRNNSEIIQLTLNCMKSRSGCWGEFDFDFYGANAYFKDAGGFPQGAINNTNSSTSEPVNNSEKFKCLEERKDL